MDFELKFIHLNLNPNDTVNPETEFIRAAHFEKLGLLVTANRLREKIRFERIEMSDDYGMQIKMIL